MIKAVGPAAAHWCARRVSVRNTAVIGSFKYNRQTAARRNGNIALDVVDVAIGHIDRIACEGNIGRNTRIVLATTE